MLIRSLKKIEWGRRTFDIEDYISSSFVSCLQVHLPHTLKVENTILFFWSLALISYCNPVVIVTELKISKPFNHNPHSGNVELNQRMLWRLSGDWENWGC